MSVYDLVQTPEAKEMLDRVIPKYARSQRWPAVVPNSAGSASLAGTAIDYAIRFEFQRRFPAAKEGRWTAEEAVEDLALRSPKLVGRARRRVLNARVFLRKHVKRCKTDDAWFARLSDYALKLARLDPIVRAGYVGADLLESNAPEQIRCVQMMLAAYPWATIPEGTPVILNPTFGSVASSLGGADADLIIGDRLVDIKATGKSDVEREMVRQLVCYLILARLARAEGLEVPIIRTIEVYFARFGQHWVMDANSVVNHPDYPAVEAWFIAYCQEPE